MENGKSNGLVTISFLFLIDFPCKKFVTISEFSCNIIWLNPTPKRANSTDESSFARIQAVAHSSDINGVSAAVNTVALKDIDVQMSALSGYETYV